MPESFRDPRDGVVVRLYGLREWPQKKLSKRVFFSCG